MTILLLPWTTGSYIQLLTSPLGYLTYFKLNMLKNKLFPSGSGPKILRVILDFSFSLIHITHAQFNLPASLNVFFLQNISRTTASVLVQAIWFISSLDYCTSLLSNLPASALARPPILYSQHLEWSCQNLSQIMPTLQTCPTFVRARTKPLQWPPGPTWSSSCYLSGLILLPLFSSLCCSPLATWLFPQHARNTHASGLRHHQGSS